VIYLRLEAYEESHFIESVPKYTFRSQATNPNFGKSKMIYFTEIQQPGP